MFLFLSVSKRKGWLVQVSDTFGSVRHLNQPTLPPFPASIVKCLKERRNNNFPIWAVAFPTGLRCFVGHVALATLPSRALSAGKIPTPKTRTYYCDVPKKNISEISLENHIFAPL